MRNISSKQRLIGLLDNSRFWFCATGIVLSIIILGFVQWRIPPGSLQNIRLEEIYGFLALGLLYAAVLVSPLYAIFPTLPYKTATSHVRRAIGVLAFYYAGLHALITFFEQFGGFGGIQYLNTTYGLSLLLAVIGLVILFFMTITSLDWAVRTMGFKKWKILHRLAYVASIVILLHVLIIGVHYMTVNLWSVLTIIAFTTLFGLEMVRSYRFWRGRRLAVAGRKRS